MKKMGDEAEVVQCPFKFSLLTTKQITSPATRTREKRGLLTLDFDLVTHHTLTQCSQPQNVQLGMNS